jgi:type IX secretion system PorP/SprF family membrane protein
MITFSKFFHKYKQLNKGISIKVQRFFKIFIFLQFTNILVAQDVQFSQLFADRLYLNPAYAGADYCPKLALSYRNQWPGVQFPYVTYSASIDKYFPALSGGLGFRIMNDKQGGGTFSQLGADLIYSYHVNLSRKISAKFALQASVYQKSMNVRDLVFPSMIDPVQGVIYPNSEGLADQSFITPDFSAGVLLNYQRYFIGFSANHIPHTVVENHSEYFPMKYTVHAGALIPIDYNDSKKASFVLEPNIVFINQQNMNMLYYGMYFDINNASIGAFIRNNLDLHFDAMILSFHLNVNNLVISYSYGITLSRFIGQSLGSHELSLTYLFACDKKIRNYNTISCPSF